MAGSTRPMRPIRCEAAGEGEGQDPSGYVDRCARRVTSERKAQGCGAASRVQFQLPLPHMPRGFYIRPFIASGIARDSPSWSFSYTEIVFEYTFKLRAEPHTEHYLEFMHRTSSDK